MALQASGIAGPIAAIGLLLAAIVPAGASGLREAAAARVTVRIESFRHVGKDAYSVVVATMNGTPRDLVVRVVTEGFFIQTEQGWAEIPAPHRTRHRSQITLPAGRRHERSASISIPLTIPHLFATYEGDLSLKYQYVYEIRSADGGGDAVTKSDELYCWITPGTSKWILREGM